MRLACVLGIALLGTACEYSYVEPGSAPKPAPPPTPPARPTAPEVVALREAVLAAAEPIPDHPEYTPRDPALYPSIVDPWIETTLERLPHATRDEIVAAAASSIAAALMRTPEGVDALERTLTDRYQHPVVTRDGELVRIDLGYIPGKPSHFRGALMISSPHAENGSHGLVASEVIRNLQAGMAAHPDASTYQVEIEIPGRWRSGDGYTYIYDRREDRIRLYVQDKRDVYYRTAVLGGAFDGIDRLVWSTMESQPMDRAPVRSVDLAQRAP